LAILFLPPGFARAEEAADVARSAARSAPLVASTAAPTAAPRQSATSSDRGKSEQRPAPAAARGAATATRTVTVPESAATTAPPSGAVQTRAATPSAIAVRTNAATPPAATATRQGAGAGADRANSIRSASASRAAAIGAVKQPSAVAARSGAAAMTTANMSRARAASTSGGAVGAAQSAYGKCKETYFSCMDEFCANKDASLRRCACSSRLHEFDGYKKALAESQSKLADFQSRLLAVSMDKEDAEAMVKATEGETAYAVKDKSASQKALDAIMNKIEAMPSDGRQAQSLAALNLATMQGSADMFDPVDMTLRADFTAKEGEALYGAALPVCADMSKELCGESDVSIIESAYRMAIEQDCNTLVKNYELLQSGAKEKTREASALLDMSRLINYQDRNSADAPACMRQMLEIINTDAVCGADLGKCLDPTGKYVDPATGRAILSEDLAELEKALKSPLESSTPNQKWAAMSENATMVRFLESKKTYIEPAMKNCEDLRKTVWDNFVETALSKIKLAQRSRLEDMRQNCTIVINECKIKYDESITEFDQRALSVLGVAANSVVNKMCADVQSACGALMEGTINGTGKEWMKGMDDIDAQKTYETLKKNCKLIGQDCIRRTCQSNDGSLDLCKEKRILRKKIINTAYDMEPNNLNVCYMEVQECVKGADEQVLKKIVENNSVDFSRFTTATRGTGLYDFQKISRWIWGNCSPNDPSQDAAEGTEKSSKIDIEFTDSVLAWFSSTTKSIECEGGGCTDTDKDIFIGTKCVPKTDVDSTFEECGSNKIIINKATGFNNCCSPLNKDGFGNCCQSKGLPSDTHLVGGRITFESTSQNGICNSAQQCCFDDDKSNRSTDQFSGKYCSPSEESKWHYIATAGNKHLFCLGDWSKDASHKCTGTFVSVNATTGIYKSRFDIPNPGTEKYLNYFYANMNNNEGKVADQHFLVIYKSDGTWIMPSNKTTPSAWPGWSASPQNLRHSVAFCDDGFKIDKSGKGSFSCCASPPEDPRCKNYEQWLD